MLFSIDHGNSAIKTPNFVFTSGLADYPVKPPVETDVLEFGGQFWTLSGQRIAYMRDKTADDRFFVLTLFAVAKEMQKANMLQSVVETDLAVGLPPEHYELRKQFAEYFQRGRVSFVFNNTPICLVIGNVMVYPQAYAAVVPRAQRLQESSRTFIIDIGGFTTDVLLLRESKPDLQFCRSLEMGVIPMSNDIIGRVSALYGIRIDDDHIVDVIQVDLRAAPAVFVGGGAVLFKSFVEGSPLLANADFIEDPKANAVGYDLLGTAQQRRAGMKAGDGSAQG